MSDIGGEIPSIPAAEILSESADVLSAVPGDSPAIVITQVFEGKGDGRDFLQNLADGNIQVTSALPSEPGPLAQQIELVPPAETEPNDSSTPAKETHILPPNSNHREDIAMEIQRGLLEQRVDQLLEEISRDPDKGQELLKTIQSVAKLLETVIKEQKQKEAQYLAPRPQRIPSERPVARRTQKLEQQLVLLLTLIPTAESFVKTQA